MAAEKGTRRSYCPLAGESQLSTVVINGGKGYVLAKRILDIILSCGFLVVSTPLLLCIAVAIVFDDGIPVLYSQMRLGCLGKPFRIWKFRTMHRGADKAEPAPSTQEKGVPDDFVFQIKQDPRVTRVGRWLRKYSLDELPQFVNVLLGQMSLVGPRPEPMSVSECYNSEQKLRLLVKPGLTGLAQVYGRGELTMKEKLAMDLEYIGRRSISLDILLLLKTVPVVFRSKGVR